MLIILKFINMNSNKKPIFYQSSKFNIGMHEENWTKFELNI
jgi:hypothetical protein